MIEVSFYPPFGRQIAGIANLMSTGDPGVESFALLAQSETVCEIVWAVI